ncbi:hypothetical protein P154DRAFT_580145 [Amniculicola lignicola CBS 123094]|uniref:Uncharacterized protein n=1 Tax=Amniculicola lignicola CBS 123094 TaxID=1392246 RepID=A0A6A5W4N2_9PLEO|nr:hypothetical protein P154DRAFT_580145 [Amniculicola lignicola CBS 123094]
MAGELPTTCYYIWHETVHGRTDSELMWVASIVDRDEAKHYIISRSQSILAVNPTWKTRYGERLIGGHDGAAITSSDGTEIMFIYMRKEMAISELDMYRRQVREREQQEDAARGLREGQDDATPQPQQEQEQEEEEEEESVETESPTQEPSDQTASSRPPSWSPRRSPPPRYPRDRWSISAQRSVDGDPAGPWMVANEYNESSWDTDSEPGEVAENGESSDGVHETEGYGDERSDHAEHPV